MSGWATLRWMAGGLLGIAIGVGAFTFVYAKGSSYLGHDAAACANCHVMRDQYEGWIRSSHRSVAACNDCHTPHALIPKYATKALNGFRHSWAFTTGEFHEPIRIKGYNRAITEHACRSCHGDIVQAMDAGERPHGRGDASCVRCHHGVGHGSVGSVSAGMEEP
jgi:cytochrome c nitrite reductase small subunit